MNREWYIKVMGDDLGPYTISEVSKLARDGTVNADTWVRKGLKGEWTLASNVAGVLETRTEVRTSVTEPVRTSSLNQALTQTPVRLSVSAQPPAPIQNENRSLGPRSMAATKEPDEVFYDYGGIKVTRTRFIVSGQTYALNAITSVRQGFYIVRGNRLPLVLLICFGALLALMAFGSIV